MAPVSCDVFPMLKTQTKVIRNDDGPGCPLPSGISIVIPVYNSADVLPVLFERLERVAPSFDELFELILVNDGSRDGSWSVILQLCKSSPWVRGFCLMRNYGQHNALLCGIRAARFDTLVTMDDDLQHAFEDIPRLRARLQDQFDVVYATPEDPQNGFLRALAGRITRQALRTAVGNDVAKNVSAFRVFRTELRDAFADYQTPFVSVDVLLTWATTRFVAVPVPFHPRYSGTSNYTFGKLLRHAIDMMTGFSTAPLQLASLIGFGCMLFGIGVFFYVVGRYFIGGSIPGFPFLASIIAIFSGAQLFALGVIGEYLARMHFRMMDRPAYVVRNTTQTNISNPELP
jgi:glycosyltransferase involved in cell wall biosynthesis